MNRIGRSVGGQRFGPCGRNPGRHDATPCSASLRSGEGCEVCVVKCVELLTAIMPADNSSVDYLSSAGIISTSRSGGGSRQIPLPVCCGKGTFLVRKNKRLFGWGVCRAGREPGEQRITVVWRSGGARTGSRLQGVRRRRPCGGEGWKPGKRRTTVAGGIWRDARGERRIAVDRSQWYGR